MDIYMDLTIAISESDIPYRGKWAASLVESNNLDIPDESVLSNLTGYGETPLAYINTETVQALQSLVEGCQADVLRHLDDMERR